MHSAFGILLSPLVSAAIGAAVVAATSLDFEGAALLFVLFVLAGYSTTLLFGWALFLLLKRLTWLRPVPLASAGSVAALLFALLLSFVHPGRTPWHHAFINFASIGVPLGAVAGLAFWWFSVRKSSSAFHRQA